ncbi:SnoaL-like domain protein [Gimesia panareensis]|uniref:SnoaL-like domain protein n=2 Tax=Gimesia panareensis TaxID=2527978 RepID=A0A517Q8B5_9PLAN|nr:SnoaL-like domain protein [Gimesia panareensis]
MVAEQRVNSLTIQANANSFLKDIRMNLSPNLARWGLTFSVLSVCLLLDSSIAKAQFQRTPLTGGTAAAGEAPAPEKNHATEKKAKVSEAEQAIRKVAGEFTKAFNAGDARKVAGFWAPEGEYVEASGMRLVGRPAIEKAYTAYFKENKQARIQIQVDSVRQIGDDLAIEEGRTMVTVPEGTPDLSQYTATHVRQNGKWKMVSVKESSLVPSAMQVNLNDLEWLIGTWEAEDVGIALKTVYRWMPGKKFIERTFTAQSQSDGKSKVMGTQIIGVDPLTGDIMSWTFNTDGSHAIGIWAPVENGWVIESRGVTPDGMLTSANNVITKIDEKACRWQSVNRTVNGVELPDALEVVSKRQ